ncbi:thioredoxin-like protein [Chaetomium sp. MPI-SDFR-AT-0129]|uniref:Thioredoxin-like protein n=1 Tax=Dichotomopilus funicola TaxID=1934379 RepID=A0AAN6UXB5_9PEZI|nr:thioredoxin-like protein [Chaetomium sp. MPI-SDFR-AT-0129]KAK4140220.1 thioredoxin-like protein [Dichotomopilus funicola]
MFRFHKTLDMITLFHKASSPASVRLAAALRQASAVASETSTADQASDHSAQTKEATSRPEFQLEVTETPPTADQLRTILGYVGGDRISTLVKGATDEQEALRKYAENVENLQRPVVVDWNNGKVGAGENESEILKMLNQLQK